MSAFSIFFSVITSLVSPNKYFPLLLSKNDLLQILDKIINEIENRLIDINVKINLTDNAKNYFIDNGYDEYYGARPLKRLVNNKLETILAKKLINNEIKPNTTINVDFINNEIKVA